MFKSEATQKAVLSLTYPYGFSRQPLPQCVTYQHSSATRGSLGRVKQLGQTNSHHKQQKKARKIGVPEEWCCTGREERSSSALVWMCSFLPSATQGSGEAAEYGGTSAFREQHSCLTRARTAPHKGRPRKVRNVLVDPCQVPLSG